MSRLGMKRVSFSNTRMEQIELCEDDLPEFFNDLFAEFGYDSIVEYFRKYESRPVTLIIPGGNDQVPDLILAKGKTK